MTDAHVVRGKNIKFAAEEYNIKALFLTKSNPKSDDGQIWDFIIINIKLMDKPESFLRIAFLFLGEFVNKK